jgi:hypothetical protein
MREMMTDEDYLDASEEYNDFINSLDDVGLHNLENALEAMEVENSKRKRSEYSFGDSSTSVRQDGPQERPIPWSNNKNLCT